MPPVRSEARGLAEIRRRVYLTYRYEGLWGSVYRVLAFPLRYTPLRRYARLAPRRRGDPTGARRWYQRNARPVGVVIAGDGDAERTRASVRRTASPRLARVLDAVPAAAGGDIVVLRAGVEVCPGWLAGLQFAAHRGGDVGIVGPMVLDAAGETVRSVGLCCRGDRFEARYAGRARDWGPASVVGPVLALGGECMYLRRELIDALGGPPGDPIDYCQRAWAAGWRVLCWPHARVACDEVVPLGAECRGDARPVRAADGGLRVIYVTEDTGVGGGHRDIFEHVNGLLARGHHPEVWSLSGQPDWFDLHVAVRSFADYAALIDALEPREAIKVATWWNTGGPVWRASVLHGIPVYFVQDIETAYYPHDEAVRDAVLASYRSEFHFMTISSWNAERLRELGLDAELIPPGIDLARFRPLPERARRADVVLALGRSEPLKNLPLTLAAWRGLPDPRPELCLFGIEPALAPAEPGVRYVVAPSDEEVNELFNTATVLVQTSIHEGFCLPPLEMMATGGCVVATDADGNRDFCVDGVNCLMPAADAASVTAALGRALGDPALRERLGAAGRATAAGYAWSRRLDALEAFLGAVAGRA